MCDVASKQVNKQSNNDIYMMATQSTSYIPHTDRHVDVPLLTRLGTLHLLEGLYSLLFKLLDELGEESLRI